MRVRLGATWFADEIADARLFLKIVGDVKPTRLRLGLATAWWDNYFTAYADARALVDETGLVSVDVTDEPDGWISVPVTDCVKAWLRGDLQNNGLAIFGETPGEVYTFVSIVGSEESESGIAYIKASGAVRAASIAYGKFEYTEMPSPDERDLGGNCMSYALRDVNMILGDDLGADPGEMNRIYDEAGRDAGVDALADYFARLAADYVEAHKEGLLISRFRRLEDFDSEIDTEAEYRVALRFGVQFPGDADVDFSDERASDYHFWMQLRDGRWAQKFPAGPSEIVPGTGPGISPGKFPWDSGYNRSAKTADYYTSKTIYFAVTKDTDEFTRHRGETEDRPLGP
jgi:hypothetical protein